MRIKFLSPAQASWNPLRLLDGIDHTLLFEAHDGRLEHLMGYSMFLYKLSLCRSQSQFLCTLPPSLYSDYALLTNESWDW